MTDTPPVIYVTIYSTTKPLFKTRNKFQPWRWKATSAGNNRTLASGEAFHNREDCLHSVELLFGAFTDVHIRALDQTRVLRLASDEKPF